MTIKIRNNLITLLAAASLMAISGTAAAKTYRPGQSVPFGPYHFKVLQAFYDIHYNTKLTTIPKNPANRYMLVYISRRGSGTGINPQIELLGPGGQVIQPDQQAMRTIPRPYAGCSNSCKGHVKGFLAFKASPGTIYRLKITSKSTNVHSVQVLLKTK